MGGRRSSIEKWCEVALIKVIGVRRNCRLSRRRRLESVRESVELLSTTMHEGRLRHFCCRFSIVPLLPVKSIILSLVRFAVSCARRSEEENNFGASCLGVMPPLTVIAVGTFPVSRPKRTFALPLPTLPPRLMTRGVEQSKTPTLKSRTSSLTCTKVTACTRRFSTLIKSIEVDPSLAQSTIQGSPE